MVDFRADVTSPVSSREVDIAKRARKAGHAMQRNAMADLCPFRPSGARADVGSRCMLVIKHLFPLFCETPEPPGHTIGRRGNCAEVVGGTVEYDR